MIKQIDEWEKNNIERIRLRAKELREQLLQSTAIQISQLSKRIEPITEQITNARQLDDFIETDLTWWKEKIDLIKSELNSPLYLAINEEEIPLVSNIAVVLKTLNERFDRTSDGRVRIAEDGEVVIHSTSNTQTGTRGKNEYSSGCHRIRLRIESFGSILALILNKLLFNTTLTQPSPLIYGIVETISFRVESVKVIIPTLVFR